MEQILPAYGLKETYCYNDALQNLKAMVCSLDADTDFSDIVAGVLWGDTLAAFLF